MRRTAISVFTLAVALACASCGSSGNGDDSSAAGPSSATAPSGSAQSGSAQSGSAQSGSAQSSPAPGGSGQPGGQACNEQTWPQALPDFRSKALADTVVGPGLCFAIASVTSADGRDVMNDPASHTTPWTIADQTPAPGTSVTADTPVTLKVDAAQ
ncbi:hypothetical protein [Nocardia sp. BMG51109]|uniref:PASTA domain-containing protein n=1 Tax=Nocardia sp. BMG51109 TaxID=1056816 RepID=UPI0004B85973|nr:hypothetical protein [Nocardia sp. BMG51109]